MHGDPVSCGPDDTLERVATIMHEEKLGPPARDRGRPPRRHHRPGRHPAVDRGVARPSDLSPTPSPRWSTSTRARQRGRPRRGHPPGGGVRGGEGGRLRTRRRPGGSCALAAGRRGWRWPSRARGRCCEAPASTRRPAAVRARARRVGRGGGRPPAPDPLHPAGGWRRRPRRWSGRRRRCPCTSRWTPGMHRGGAAPARIPELLAAVAERAELEARGPWTPMADEPRTRSRRPSSLASPTWWPAWRRQACGPRSCTPPTAPPLLDHPEAPCRPRALRHHRLRPRPERRGVDRVPLRSAMSLRPRCPPSGGCRRRASPTGCGARARRLRGGHRAARLRRRRAAAVLGGGEVLLGGGAGRWRARSPWTS